MSEKPDCIHFDMCALRTLTRKDMEYLGMADDVDCWCEVCDEYDNLTSHGKSKPEEKYYEAFGFRYPERRKGIDRRKNGAN